MVVLAVIAVPTLTVAVADLAYACYLVWWR